MRAAAWVGGLVGWLGLVGALAAQPGDATVRVPAAEVRGGRSDIFPVTATLRQGQSVHVVREEEGYLAITPPVGSSSWVPDRFLTLSERPTRGRITIAYVNADGVPVRLGSNQSAAPLQIETVRLNRGTIVRVLGEKAFAEGMEWWRVQAPPTEVRYIAKDAVTLPSSTVVAASPAAGGSPAMAGNGRSPDPRWVQAEQAEQRRDYARARDLYSQLASEMAQPGGDHDLAIRCYNRIDQLDRRGVPLATWPARQPAPGVLVSNSARASAVTPAPPAVAPVPSLTPSGPVSSGPGWLRRTGVLIEGKSAYVLEDDRGQPRHYLLAQPGLNLEMFVNRPVEVFGPLVQRPDLMGGGYISVNRLHLLR